MFANTLQISALLAQSASSSGPLPAPANGAGSMQELPVTADFAALVETFLQIKPVHQTQTTKDTQTEAQPTGFMFPFQANSLLNSAAVQDELLLAVQIQSPTAEGSALETAWLLAGKTLSQKTTGETGELEVACLIRSGLSAEQSAQDENGTESVAIVPLVLEIVPAGQVAQAQPLDLDSFVVWQAALQNELTQLQAAGASEPGKPGLGMASSVAGFDQMVATAPHPVRTVPPPVLPSNLAVAELSNAVLEIPVAELAGLFEANQQNHPEQVRGFARLLNAPLPTATENGTATPILPGWRVQLPENLVSAINTTLTGWMENNVSAPDSTPTEIPSYLPDNIIPDHSARGAVDVVSSKLQSAQPKPPSVQLVLGNIAQALVELGGMITGSSTDAGVNDRPVSEFFASPSDRPSFSWMGTVNLANHKLAEMQQHLVSQPGQLSANASSEINTAFKPIVSMAQHELLQTSPAAEGTNSSPLKTAAVTVSDLPQQAAVLSTTDQQSQAVAAGTNTTVADSVQVSESTVQQQTSTTTPTLVQPNPANAGSGVVTNAVEPAVARPTVEMSGSTATNQPVQTGSENVPVGPVVTAEARPEIKATSQPAPNPVQPNSANAGSGVVTNAVEPAVARPTVEMSGSTATNQPVQTGSENVPVGPVVTAEARPEIKATSQPAPNPVQPNPANAGSGVVTNAVEPAVARPPVEMSGSAPTNQPVQSAGTPSADTAATTSGVANNSTSQSPATQPGATSDSNISANAPQTAERPVQAVPLEAPVRSNNNTAITLSNPGSEQSAADQGVKDNPAVQSEPTPIASAASKQIPQTVAQGGSTQTVETVDPGSNDLFVGTQRNKVAATVRNQQEMVTGEAVPESQSDSTAALQNSQRTLQTSPAASGAAVTVETAPERRLEPTVQGDSESSVVRNNNPVQSTQTVSSQSARPAAPATPGTVLTPAQESDAMQQIVHAVRIQQTTRGSEIRIRLVPESLGEVHLRIQQQGQVLIADLQAVQSVTRELLNKHAREIQTILQESGIRVDQVVIRTGPLGGHEVGQQPQQQRNWTSQQQSQSGSSSQQHPDNSSGNQQDSQQQRQRNHPSPWGRWEQWV